MKISPIAFWRTSESSLAPGIKREEPSARISEFKSFVSIMSVALAPYFLAIDAMVSFFATT